MRVKGTNEEPFAWMDCESRLDEGLVCLSADQTRLKPEALK